MIQQSLPTLKSGRSLHAGRMLRFAFALQLVCDPQCRWPSRTIWRFDPFHQAGAYTEIGTSEIGRLYPVSVFRSQMGLGVISQRFVRLELSPSPPDEDLFWFARRSGSAFLQSSGPDNRASSGRSEERRVGKECRSRWSPYH